MRRPTGMGWTTLALLASANCGSGASSQSASCDNAPWACPQGTVCWPTDSGMACIAAGIGQVADTCTASIGSATCGSGLFCFDDAETGTCVPYCSNTDGSHPCPTDNVCTATVLTPATGIAFSICLPVTPASLDAGLDSSPEDASLGTSSP